jgi:hypothetical protein
MLNEWQKIPETEKRERVTAFIADLAPYEVELHLSTDSDLPKKYGKAIKAAGGRYSEARGTGCLHRYVHLPNTARKLINTLVAEFGFWHGARSNDKVTMIARPARDKLPTHVAVGGVTKACEDPIDSFERKLVRKVLEARANDDHCGELTNAEVAARDKALTEAIAEQKAQQKLGALLYAAKPTSLDEFHALVYALEQLVLRQRQDPTTTVPFAGSVASMLERMRVARTEFNRPEKTLAESLAEHNLPPLDAIVDHNSKLGGAS